MRPLRPLVASWALAALALALLLPFPYVAPIRPPNELSRLYQARSIVEDHSLAVDGMISRHGLVGDLSGHAGRRFPNKAPGVSLLGAGVHWAHSLFTEGDPKALPLDGCLWLQEKLILGLGTLALLLLLGRSLQRWTDSRWAASLALLAYGFASSALPYSLLLFSHQLAAILLFAGWEAYRAGAHSRSTRWVALGGALHGLALLSEYTVAPAVLLLSLEALFAPAALGPARPALVSRRALAGLAGAALPLLGLLAYHQAAFGHPLHTGYDHISTEALAPIHAVGFLGVQLPRLDWLAFSLFSPGRGLIHSSPWTLLVPLGLWHAARRQPTRAELRGVLWVSACYLSFTASWDPAVWGWVVGPRHLVPLLPFLVGPSAAALDWLRNRPGALGVGLAGGAAGVIGAAGALTLLATLTYPHFPEEVANPHWGLIVPLAAAGHAGSGAFEWLFDLSGPLSHGPIYLSAALAFGAAAALFPGAATAWGRRRALSAALVGALSFLALTFYPGGPRPPPSPTLDFAARTYSPKPGAPLPAPWRR